jgi:hypothetical protein
VKPQHKSPHVAERSTADVEAEFDGHVVTALRRAPRDTRGLARDMGVPVGRVQASLKRLRESAPGRVKNVGMQDLPRWTWSVGDDSTPDELAEQMIGLLEMRPMYFAELMKATGARRARVDSVLTSLRRVDRLEDIGTSERRKLWRLLPPRVTRT